MDPRYSRCTLYSAIRLCRRILLAVLLIPLFAFFFELGIVFPVELDLRHQEPGSDESGCVESRTHDKNDSKAFVIRRRELSAHELRTIISKGLSKEIRRVEKQVYV